MNRAALASIRYESGERGGAGRAATQFNGGEANMIAAAASNLERGLAARGHRSRIRVSVSVESKLFRSELETVLRNDGRFDVLPNDHACPANLANAGLDVVLADVCDYEGGLGLAERAGAPKLVLLADGLTRTELLRTFGARLAGLLPRSASGRQICAALEAASFDLITFTADEWKMVAPETDSDDEQEGAIEALTPREAEVLALMAKGLSNKAIADRLKISEHTAKFHVSSILAKLGASTRTEAVTRGLKDGMLII